MHFEVFCTNALGFVGGKTGMPVSTIAMNPATTTYIGGKPLSFLVFGQNGSKWVLNLHGKPVFSE